jgi:zinc D-Ala-D-Ala carboxypeptidase
VTRRFFANVGLAAVSGALALTGCSTTVVTGLAAAEPTTGAAPTAEGSPPGDPIPIGPGAAQAPAGGPGADATTLPLGAGATDSWSGYLPDGTTLSPFDTSSQILLRLDPLLLNAIRDAARSAQAQGIDITITSGWRSKGFQQRLFDDAVRRYGIVEIAKQFVASPEASRHVVGEAVDIAGNGASDWLIHNGAQFGLCQIYANENWHFELATDGNGRCPPLRPNAAG